MPKLKSCYLCKSTKLKEKNGRVRDNPNLKIMECSECGLVFLSCFDHIGNNFYEQSLIHEKPVNIQSLLKDTSCDDERRFTCHRRLIENKSLLDFGCGAGGFLCRARSTAASVVGVEVEMRFKPHFQKENIDVFTSINDVSGRFDVITIFHVLEHMKDPVDTLRRLSGKLSENGCIIVEVPSSDDALLKLYENPAFSQFAYWSCHLFLFNPGSLSRIARKAGLKANYLKQIQRYPLSNHLYWLAKGKSGGHKIWGFLDSHELDTAYEKQLAALGLCDTIVGSFSKIK